MKLKHKYFILSNPAFAKKTVIAAAYGTMRLEDQGVSKEWLMALYDEQKKPAGSLTKAASAAAQSAYAEE